MFCKPRGPTWFLNYLRLRFINHASYRGVRASLRSLSTLHARHACLARQEMVRASGTNWELVWAIVFSHNSGHHLTQGSNLDPLLLGFINLLAVPKGTWARLLAHLVPCQSPPGSAQRARLFPPAQESSPKRSRARRWRRSRRASENSLRAGPHEQ